MSLPENLEDFEQSLGLDAPHGDWPAPLKALWWDAKGDWEKAHDLVDGATMSMAKWVHAYLHRKEGDEWNAGYWYRQAGKPFFNGTLDNEWGGLVEEILDLS